MTAGSGDCRHGVHMSPRLKALLDRLDQFEDAIPPSALKAALVESGLTVEDVADWVQYCDDHYARNRIHVGPSYHALALCWQVGQHSSIHDHSGSGCGVLVLKGHGVETVFDRGADGMLTERHTRTVDHGAVCVSVDSDIHRLGNNDEQENFVTLHVYSPPLLKWGVYAEDSPEVEIGMEEEFAESLATAD